MQLLRSILLLSLLTTPASASPASLREWNCLATVVYHESRGEPFNAQVAVAHVVMNRVADDRWPEKVCDVVYQAGQFTDIERAQVDVSGTAWRTAQEVALHALLGLSDDPTGGARWFYNPGLVTIEPSWVKGLEKAAFPDSGAHLFLRFPQET